MNLPLLSMDPPPSMGLIKSTRRTPVRAHTTPRTCNPTTVIDKEMSEDNMGH